MFSRTKRETVSKVLKIWLLGMKFLSHLGVLFNQLSVKMMAYVIVALLREMMDRNMSWTERKLCVTAIKTVWIIP